MTGVAAAEAPVRSDAAELPYDTAELGREIERVCSDMERGIQLAGLKNDPLAPLLRTLAVSLSLQWRLHEQAVSYQRGASALLDRQLADTMKHGEQSLEARRTMIVDVLAPQLARMTARSTRPWNQMVTLKTGLTLGACAAALACGVGLASWQIGHHPALGAASPLAAAVQQAGPGAEAALVDMVRANDLPDAWARCQKSATPGRRGRRVCVMPMWAEPDAKPGRG